VNDAPVTVADTYTTLEDVRLTVAAPGILTNDTDVEGDALIARLVSNVTHGTLALNTNGGFTYLSATNYNGSDSFTYRANDGTTNGNLATVTINITPVNDPPIAVNDTYTTLEDVRLTVATPGILANDTDVEGDPLTAFLVSNGSHGSVNLNTDGSFSYTPSTNYNGTDSFTYIVSDGQTIGNIATVTINVTPVNDAPIAYDDSYTTLENVSLIVPAAAGILTNDVDVDGDVLSAWLVANVSHGSLNLKPDGSFTYTPSTNFYGSDTFTYLEDDGQIAGNIATVTINVVNTNAPLSFDSEAMTASGYNLHLSAPWGYVCVIEASTNLVDWIPIFTNSTLSGSFGFTDQTATNIPSRFYRAFAR
jgi:VCBS repeat-containing protein